MKIFWKIIKESIKILTFASLISSLGGVGLESVNAKLVALLPILILMPAMNDMMGDFGAIISSRIATLLYLGKLKEKKWWRSHVAGDLFISVGIVAVLSAVYIGLLSGAIALFKGFDLNAFFLLKLVIVTVMTTLLLVVFMFWLSATAGFYIFKKNEDPSNFLIPLTTSIADLGNMMIMTGVVMWFF